MEMPYRRCLAGVNVVHSENRKGSAWIKSKVWTKLFRFLSRSRLPIYDKIQYGRREKTYYSFFYHDTIIIVVVVGYTLYVWVRVEPVSRSGRGGAAATPQLHTADVPIVESSR